MPTLYAQAGWKITMYYRDHLPPHFHVLTRDRREAQIEIENLTVIVGDVPQKIVREAVQWAAKHKPVLMAKWRDMHPGWE